MPENGWEFWIDVGGTFTDCLARTADGRLLRHKLLSTGVFQGHVGAGSSAGVVIDPRRRHDPTNFWEGWRLVLFDAAGRATAEVRVTDYDAANGALELDGLKVAPREGTLYELRCDSEAPIVAIRYLRGLPLAEPIPPCTLRLGTTRGTNALITRTGARTALVTTRGFGDVLEIGYQVRPQLFALTVRKPSLLMSAVVEIDERMTHDGQVLEAPDEQQVRRSLQEIKRAGIESVAVCLLHADRYSAHEQLVVGIARELGFREISASHEVAPLPRIVARGDTTVVDAYLNPVLGDYVEKLRESLPDSRIRLLTSAGGLVAAEQFRGKDSILSGPAGGVVGFSRVAQAAGFRRAIGFDMGGTSTDVSRFDGHYDLDYEIEKGGVRLVAPSMAIETVAAGGGSICRYDGVKLVVGPESAGADPGPACYGHGGPLTVTDVNLYLGRIVPERFPFPLDIQAVEQRLDDLCTQLATDGETRYSREQLAAGFVRIANANMAAAIRLVTVAKGANPADYVLVAFGGAAPQHACAVARELGIRQVLNHPDAGILSAYGIGQADVTRHRSLGLSLSYSSAALGDANAVLDKLADMATQEIVDEGVPAERIEQRRSLDLRYRGTDSSLTVPCPADGDYRQAFHDMHRGRYGYAIADRPVEIVAARVAAVAEVARLEAGNAASSNPATSATTHASGQVYERAQLAVGDLVEGPAIVTEDNSTTVIDEGWRAEVLDGGELLLTDRQEAAPTDEPPSDAALARADPVLLEVFNNQFAMIAEQMGVTLRNTASSVNVKERLDFSCAVFTADGRLVANAPHMPVHLGAMEETVRHVLAANPTLTRGEVIATNDPYQGGSHLPDITVVSPVHDPETGEIAFITASRAHHAEIGGITPGSMPPASRSLADEGVIIRNLKLVAGGEFRESQLRELLATGPHPSRDPDSNVTDLAAQVAANRQGADDLLALYDRYSRDVIAAYMGHIQTAAEQKVRQALSRREERRCEFTDYLETSSGESVPIRVTITIAETGADPAATFDFTGTGPVDRGNLNANRAIVHAAVIYCLRLLIDEDIPLNHGVLKPVKIVLPPGLLNPRAGATPETTPAVAGGNVETSQRVVDVVLGALGLAAASQGTMNNLVFGNESFGYYETICGGSGATRDGGGASAVQVHMTNTRSTDPEILERRYPVRVRQFSVRRGSGGEGQHQGGDGAVRELEFLAPLQLSLLTQRRGPHPPYGLASGAPGALGQNLLVARDGTTRELDHIAQCAVQAGDRLRIETPGGGGFGPAE